MDSFPDMKTAPRLFVDSYAYLQRAFGSRLEPAGLARFLRFGKPSGKITGEFFVENAAPQEAAEAARQAAVGAQYWLTVFTQDLGSAQRAYTALGYERSDSEYLMGRALPAGKTFTPDERVKLVSSPAEIEKINRTYGNTLFHPDQLQDRDLLFAWAEKDERAVAWGSAHINRRTFPDRPPTAYIASMYTLPGYRRRGLAEGVLSTLLAASMEAGARASVLVSSQLGHPLYLKLGFRDLLYLQVFISPRA